MSEAKNRPAAFINAIAEEGTKEEAVKFLRETWNELCEARARIRELEAAQGVAVKPLEWVDDRAGLWGNGLFAYIIRPGGEGYYWFRRNGTHTNILPDKPGIEAAKAAAQADYERRIRSALAGQGGE